MKTKRTAWLVYTVSAVIYLVLNFVIPPDARTLTKYQISAHSVQLLSLTFAIPLVVIWALAFYGFIQYKTYALTIKKSKDGAAHSLIANGLMVLAISLPLSSIVLNLLSWRAQNHPGFIPASVIIANYFNIVLTLIAFLIIYQGVHELTRLIRRPKRPRNEQLLYIAFAIFGAVFIYLSLANPARTIPTVDVPKAVYYLPDWLIVGTIIAPYLYVWFVGIFSAYRLDYYRNNIGGTLYRQAFRQLAAGFAVVIVSSIMIRYISSLATALNHLSFKYLLLLIYALLIIIAAGYILIALGAKKLRKIEEV